jgi:PAS domain S-box-containing protein
VIRDLTLVKKHETRLRESEARYRILADNASDMICRLTLQGECLYVSPACQTLLNYTPQELPNRSLFDLIHRNDRESVRKAFESFDRPNEPVTLNYRVARKDGRHLWVETTFRRITGVKSDKATELLGITRNISVRKQVEEELRQAKEVAEALNRAKS